MDGMCLGSAGFISRTVVILEASGLQVIGSWFQIWVERFRCVWDGWDGEGGVVRLDRPRSLMLHS